MVAFVTSSQWDDPSQARRGGRASRALRRWGAVALALALGAAAAPSPVFAGEPPEPTEDFHPPRDASRAASAYARGKELYEADKLEEAYAAFREAERFDPGVGAYIANLGTVELVLGRHVDAANHLHHSMFVLAADAQNADKVAALKRLLDQARAEVTTLEVQCATRGASVAVDGKRVAETPLERPLYVAPGQHVVRVGKAGYEPQTRPLEARKGATQTLSVVLVARDVAPPEPEAPEGPDATAQIATVVAGSVVSAGLLGGAVGATLAANGARADSNAIHDELDPSRSNDSVCFSPVGHTAELCGELREALDRGDQLTDAAIWLYVAAGATTVGTVLAGALWPSAEEPPATVGFVPSPEGLTVVARAAF